MDNLFALQIIGSVFLIFGISIYVTIRTQKYQNANWMLLSGLLLGAGATITALSTIAAYL